MDFIYSIGESNIFIETWFLEAPFWFRQYFVRVLSWGMWQWLRKSNPHALLSLGEYFEGQQEGFCHLEDTYLFACEPKLISLPTATGNLSQERGQGSRKWARWGRPYRLLWQGKQWPPEIPGSNPEVWVPLGKGPCKCDRVKDLIFH